MKSTGIISAISDKLHKLLKDLEKHGYAPVPRTGQITSYLNGDDGALQKGVPWPVPRFTDKGDGTVTDNLTGLVWTKNAAIWGVAFLPDACQKCQSLADGQGGLTDGSSAGDWRLPNIRELQSLIDYGNYRPALPTGHPFDGSWTNNVGTVLNVFTDGLVWSSTIIMRSPEVERLIRSVEFATGTIVNDYSYQVERFVWPVRDLK